MMFTLNKPRIVKRPLGTLTDGIMVSPTAAIELDTAKLSDYELFYIQRAIAKGALRVVQYEVVSEDNEV